MNEQLITVKELGEKLKVPHSFIYSRTRQKGPDTIPMIRVGKYCRFRLSEVLAWLEKTNRDGENE
jgi:excisionase family DNA binding protein